MLDYRSSNMYYPLRHESNANKESMLNGSATSLLDGSANTARPFGASSFTSQSGTTPNFNHTANLQGVHNQGIYNMQTMPNGLSSRNTGFGGPSSGTHQSGGSSASGRFSTNSLGVGLSQQLSQGGLYGHSSMTNRTGTSLVGNHSYSSNVNVGGSGVGSPGSSSISNRASLSGMGGSPSQMGSVGPRIVSSVGGVGLAGGGGLTRALNAGVGVNMQNLNSSRVNMGQLSGSNGIGVQGPGRPANSLLQQGVNISSSTYNPSGDLLAMLSRASPQGVSSMLGNNFSTSPSSNMQGQLYSANGHVGVMSPSSVGNGNDGVAFDINDFPQLTTRQSPSGNMQGSVGGLRKQGINALVQQNQEFSIQNEDFPALPGGNHDLASELQQHHKDQQHDLAAMQVQHFLMGRSTGFSQGGFYASNRHMLQQQQQQPAGNASEPQHLHAGVGGSFSSARGHPSYHSEMVGAPGSGATQVHRSGVGGALGQYDHSLNYQHQSPSRAGGTFTQQLLQAGMAGALRDSLKQGGTAQQPDLFGLLGLLSVIRMSDPDLTTLALGTDLTTLGLNLNSRENLYKTFSSPWADEPIRGEPDFLVPLCYDQKAPQLQPNHFTKFQDSTLFYIFYSMPRDEAQIYAASELSNRGWVFQKELSRWLKRAPNCEPMVKTQTYERGTFFFLDPTTMEIGCKENFVLHYDMLEKPPQLPAQQ
ncbi:probable NOT transcription complex subunit VIP2 isoform X3 [Physcomitrium patens]|uniref:probable NOT transcription complex subunit VIP2 isoform X3 n=1 Tax=Physcomitrium patens TaxID=3218 RepID=UPI000D176C62|nr:probable NOT transcription complex subunit VIP2 isoform X3 [Physcomitrium patens]|eukprot:XP_024386892.1 probable NOT transcription complex subunit VIP2 isoform X3 [Physcomitrella patens]